MSHGLAVATMWSAPPTLATDSRQLWPARLTSYFVGHSCRHVLPLSSLTKLPSSMAETYVRPPLKRMSVMHEMSAPRTLSRQVRPASSLMHGRQLPLMNNCFGSSGLIARLVGLLM